MTLKRLLEKFQGIKITGYGHYCATFEHRGKIYKITTTNSLAYDRIHYESEIPENEKGAGGYTYKEALMSIWNECTRNYNLY